MAGELGGSFLGAIGTYNFAVSLKVPMTGITGVAMIFNRLYGLPLGWMTLILNVPLALLCIRVLGKKFFFRSIRCMLFLSLMVDYVAPKLPVYTGDRLLAALGAGVLSGLGYGLIYKQNSSSGGTDFLTVAFQSRFRHISMGTLEFITAVLVMGAYAIVFDDMDGIMYGLVINYLTSAVINRILTGANEGSVTFTVTDRPQEVCDIISKELDRGSTVLEASGGYTGEKRAVVMAVTSPKEVYVLQRALEKEVPGSFSVLMNCSEIHGEGFSVLELGKEK